MTNDSLTDRRLQLLARGYRIIPTRGKVPAIAGWQTQDYLDRELQPVGPKGSIADRLARWPRRWPGAHSTGVRVEDGLIVIDIDVDDGLVVDELMRWLSVHAPQVARLAPLRYGASPHKLALFARIGPGDDLFIRRASRKYDGHQVEVFGGEKLSGERCSRQFVVDGPHSYHDDGSVAAFYSWAEGPALHEVELAALPQITRTQISGLIDFFEVLARQAGWQLPATPEFGAIVYDITEATRFDTNHGDVGLDYAGLCDAYAVHGDSLRCSRNFMPGRGDSGRTDTCLIGDQNRHGVVAVWVPGDETLHCPANEALAALDEPRLADMLQRVAATHELALPLPEPNWRERYKGGVHPRPSLHNARLAIEALKVHCCKDLFHLKQFMGRSDAAAPGEPLLPFFGPVGDDSIASLRIYLSNSFGFDLTEKHIRDAVNTMCLENAFDPVLDMLAEAEASWDGKPRLGRMAVDHFNTADTELNRQMVRKTMIAAVARARVPGCKFDTILTLESREGWNKSSAWDVLAGEGNFSDESILGKAGREVQEQLGGIWIHESADLAGMLKAEVETVKAFASRRVDRARPAYAHYLLEQPRRSIEVATTNDQVYLLSFNGNRRFWPIEVTAPINLRKLRAARLQLWGEAAHCQSQGEELTLDEALWPVAGAEQEARRVKHPWEAKLAAMTEVQGKGHPLAGMGYIGDAVIHLAIAGTEQRVSTVAIFDHVLRVPAGQQNNGQSKLVAQIMRRLGWENTVFLLEGTSTRGYKRTKIAPNDDNDV